MDTAEAAAVSPYRGKLFRLQVGAVLVPQAVVHGHDHPDKSGPAVYTDNSPYCFGLDGLRNPDGSSLVEVLIGDKIFWVGKNQVVV